MSWATVITDPDQYESLKSEMDQHAGYTSAEFRRRCAIRAFEHTARYDALILNIFAHILRKNRICPPNLRLPVKKSVICDMGESPPKSCLLQSFYKKSSEKFQTVTW